MLPESITFSNWRTALLSERGIRHSFMLSALLSMCVALVVTTGGGLLGKIIARHPHRIRLQTFAYLPYAFSPVIYAYCIQFLFLKADLSGTIAGVLLAQTLLLLPFSTLFFISHWDDRLYAMEQLAMTLGGTKRDTWMRVLIPLSRQALLTVLLQTFLLSWFDYGLTAVIGLGQVPTLSVMVWQLIGEANPFYAAIGSCLLVFPPLILLFFNKRIVFRDNELKESTNH